MTIFQPDREQFEMTQILKLRLEEYQMFLVLEARTTVWGVVVASSKAQSWRIGSVSSKVLAVMHCPARRRHRTRLSPMTPVSFSAKPVIWVVPVPHRASINNNEVPAKAALAFDEVFIDTSIY
jgi:hypothetical protein